MAFDESLLRDEPTGFDESLLRDDDPSVPSVGFQRSSVGELSSQLPRMEMVGAPAPPAPPERPAPRPEDWFARSPEEQREIVNQLELAETARLRAEKLKTSLPGTLGREAAGQIAPSLAFATGFAGSTPLGAGLGWPGMIGTGLIGGTVAAGLASDVQEAAAQAIIPEQYARYQDLIAAGRQQHPIAAAAGRIAGNLPAYQAGIPKLGKQLLKDAAVGGGLAAIQDVSAGRAPTLGTAAEGIANAVLLRDPRARALRPSLIPFKAQPDVVTHEPNLATRYAQGAFGEALADPRMGQLGVQKPITPGEANASSISQATEVHGPVPSQPLQGKGEVPVQEGEPRIQPEAQAGVQEAQVEGRSLDDVTAKEVTPDAQTKKEEEALRETVAPTAEQLQAAKPGMTPGAMELAQKHFNDVAELQRQSAAAQKAAAAATRKARIERMGKGVAGDSPASQAEQAAVAKAANYKEALEAVEALKKPEAPSGEGLGIAPPGTGRLQKLIDYLWGADQKGDSPPINVDTSTPVPDLEDVVSSKKRAVKSFGFERLPILGAIMGGSRRLTGHVNDAISSYWYDRGVGKAISSALGNEYSWLDKALATTGAERTRGLQAVDYLNKEFGKLEAKYGLEKQALEPGDSVAGALAAKAENMYKKIADKRLAQDKDLGGLSRKEKMVQLEASMATDLASGKLTKDDLVKMVDSAEENGRVLKPGLYNKIFSPEVAEALNKAFPNTNSSLRQSAVSVNNALKSIKLGFDLGVGFIQGQGLAARHPIIWGKAWSNSIQAMFSKEHMPDYVRQNIEPIRELAQMGSSVGQLQEYMAGAGKGQVIERIPVVGTAAKAFGRQFSTFLDVAKVEMWKAYRLTTPKDQWYKVAQSLESVLQTARMESVGVSGKRALIERVLLLAPSYYRGGLNQLGGALMEKGVSGNILRQSIGAQAVAGAALFYGVGKYLLGMSEEDIKKRFNPARTDFMMWRYEKDGRATEVGIGGFYRSLMRLAGETVKTSIETPGNWRSLSSDKNPLMRWYRAHSGPVVSMHWDAITGKDFMGEDSDIVTAARKAITPLGVEAVIGKEGEPSPTAAQKGGSVLGLSTFPETSSPAVKDINRKVRTWMATSDDPKVVEAFKRREEEHSSTYGTLRKAIYTGDKKLFKTEVDKLLKTRSEKDVIKTLRQRANYPFTGSKAMERDFMEQLSPEDEKTYDKAKDDQITEYEKFLDMLDASGI